MALHSRCPHRGRRCQGQEILVKALSFGRISVTLCTSRVWGLHFLGFISSGVSGIRPQTLPQRVTQGASNMGQMRLLALAGWRKLVWHYGNDLHCSEPGSEHTGTEGVFLSGYILIRPNLHDTLVPSTGMHAAKHHSMQRRMAPCACGPMHVHIHFQCLMSAVHASPSASFPCCPKAGGRAARTRRFLTAAAPPEPFQPAASKHQTVSGAEESTASLPLPVRRCSVSALRLETRRVRSAYR